VAVANRGRFAITGVEAQFRLQANSHPRLVPPKSTTRIPGFAGLDERFQRGLETIEDQDAYAGRLAPWDAAMWFATGHIADRSTDGWYSVVRWSDRWGLRWEYRLGELRRIQESAEWTP
jgi:hypothetical protein